MHSVKISVVIPTYNREKTIRYCLDSVLNQTYSPIEIIVVDDCSTDMTVPVIKSYSDIRIRCIVLDKNSGAQAARNRGIKEAKGEWIAFQDSDDEWSSQNKLEYEIKILNNNKNCIICSTGHTFINARTNEIIGKTIFKEQVDGFISEPYECNDLQTATRAIDNIFKRIDNEGVDNKKWLNKNSWELHVKTIMENLYV